jgi:ABC-type Zn uptake system ZnuABC Zn-binding protein ZnuA
MDFYKKNIIYFFQILILDSKIHFMKSNSFYTLRLSLVVVGIIFLFVISITTSYAIANLHDNTISNKEEIEDNKLNVVTSVAPIMNIVQNIGGEKINLIGLIPEGVNFYTFELIPSDVIKINKPDIIIIDGLNLETDVEKITDNEITKNSNIQILKLGHKTTSKDEWIFDFSFPKEKR